MSKLSDKELQQKLERAIEEMEKILDDEEATPNQKTYAGSNLAGLIKQYKKQFGSEKEEESKLRSVKNF